MFKLPSTPFPTEAENEYTSQSSWVFSAIKEKWNHFLIFPHSLNILKICNLPEIVGNTQIWQGSIIWKELKLCWMRTRDRILLFLFNGDPLDRFSVLSLGNGMCEGHPPWFFMCLAENSCVINSSVWGSRPYTVLLTQSTFGSFHHDVDILEGILIGSFYNQVDCSFSIGQDMHSLSSKILVNKWVLFFTEGFSASRGSL